MNWITDPQAWIALATLAALEIVLGVDNIIFIAILAGRLPQAKQNMARRIGLLLAMITRIGLLFSLSLIMRLTNPLFTVFANEISGRDIILILGGIFLLAKATLEIHHRLEGVEEHEAPKTRASSIGLVLVQIMVLDIVFSLDSIITAIGLAEELAIMIIAIVAAVLFMLAFINIISNFVEEHPTIKILALSFLMLIGLALIGDGLDRHIPKGYLYFAMGFSVFVEVLNMRIRKREEGPVRLRVKPMPGTIRGDGQARQND